MANEIEVINFSENIFFRVATYRGTSSLICDFIFTEYKDAKEIRMRNRESERVGHFSLKLLRCANTSLRSQLLKITD